MEEQFRAVCRCDCRLTSYVCTDVCVKIQRGENTLFKRPLLRPLTRPSLSVFISSKAHIYCYNMQYALHKYIL